MKKTYIIPRQRWAIMEENYLQSLSVKSDEFADEEFKMDSREQGNWSEGGSDSKGGSLWDQW